MTCASRISPAYSSPFTRPSSWRYRFSEARKMDKIIIAAIAGFMVFAAVAGAGAAQLVAGIFG